MWAWEAYAVRKHLWAPSCARSVPQGTEWVRVGCLPGPPALAPSSGVQGDPCLLPHPGFTSCGGRPAALSLPRSRDSQSETCCGQEIVRALMISVEKLHLLLQDLGPGATPQEVTQGHAI